MNESNIQTSAINAGNDEGKSDNQHNDSPPKCLPLNGNMWLHSSLNSSTPDDDAIAIQNIDNDDFSEYLKNIEGGNFLTADLEIQRVIDSLFRDDIKRRRLEIVHQREEKEVAVIEQSKQATVKENSVEARSIYKEVLKKVIHDTIEEEDIYIIQIAIKYKIKRLKNQRLKATNRHNQPPPPNKTSGRKRDSDIPKAKKEVEDYERLLNELTELNKTSYSGLIVFERKTMISTILEDCIKCIKNPAI